MQASPQNNKWVSQRIHRKMNWKHRASKHRGADKNHKKFQAQRARKKTLKQMAFDYNDFVFGHQTENQRRIQIVSSIPPRAQNFDIASAYAQFYDPETTTSTPTQHSHARAPRINVKDIRCVGFEIEYFYAESPLQRGVRVQIERRRQRALQAAADSRQWTWWDDQPRTADEEQAAIARAIAASIQLEREQHQAQASLAQQHRELAPVKNLAFSSTTIRLYGNHLKCSPKIEVRRASVEPLKMANAAWNAYQSDLGIRTRLAMTEDNCEAEWKSSNQVAPVLLSEAMDASAPELWAMYSMIFTFLGYDRLFRETCTLRMPMAQKKVKKGESARPNHGIDYYEERDYAERRRYEGYVDDVVSYIPSRMYYQTKSGKKKSFREIGEYAPEDWEQLRGLAGARMKKGKGNYSARAICV